MTDHDLLVIGGGAAGLAAAREGARGGARVLLVSASDLGGDCTFTGCVPSKTLIGAAKEGLPFRDAVARVQSAITTVAAAESADVLRAEGIDVEFGQAGFTGPGRISVDGRPRPARRTVLATGSRPAIPPVPGLEEVAYLTNETVFSPGAFGATASDSGAAPRSLIVLGGGAIGCELAQALARFGTRVVVIETADRLLPGEDPRAAAVIADVFTREGIAIHTGVPVTRVNPHDTGVTVHLSDATAVEAEHLLVATGRRPHAGGLALDRAGIALDRAGAIVTDDRLRAAPGVFAAGDVTGRAMLTHAADDMGRHAAANALRRRPKRYHPSVTPRVVFTTPEVAHVGAALADAGHATRVAYLPLDEVDRAITDSNTDGFVLLLAGPRRVLRNAGGGRVVGATIVAPRAGEMLHEVSLAMATRMFTGRLAATMHAYPTWSSAVQLTAAQFFIPINGRRARPAGEFTADGP